MRKEIEQEIMTPDKDGMQKRYRMYAEAFSKPGRKAEEGEKKGGRK